MGKDKSRIAVLASGNGSTVEAFIRNSQDSNLISTEVAVVICNNPRGKAGVYERIDSLNEEYGLNIPVVTISSKTHPGGEQGRGQTDEESQAILDEANKYKCDLVVMMGYMKIVRGALLRELGWKSGLDSIFQARLLNTHPGPLPETAGSYGLPASSQVLELGLECSYHTVHLVAEGVDTGPIIAEHPVEILPGDNKDSLFQRVQTVEKAALPYAVDLFLKQQKKFLQGDA